MAFHRPLLAIGLFGSMLAGAAVAGAFLYRPVAASGAEPAPPASPAAQPAAEALPSVPEGVRFRVMLDPGHGGSNTGCAGVVEGVYEKRVTLALTLALAGRLRAAGVDVVLTREDDRYLTLRERVRLANASGADLFLSVHANASPGRAQRGFETWVLTPEALDVDARAIRAGDGAPRPGLDDETALILDDVERGSAQPWSLRLAERLQARLAGVWGEAFSRGVRQGTQDVLMGLTMPGALVEVGFLDHPVEGARLLESETRAALVDELAAAVLDYRALRAADPR